MNKQFFSLACLLFLAPAFADNVPVCPNNTYQNPASFNILPCSLPGKAPLQVWGMLDLKTPAEYTTLKFTDVGEYNASLNVSYYINCSNKDVMPQQLKKTVNILKGETSILNIETNCTFKNVMQIWNDSAVATKYGALEIVLNDTTVSEYEVIISP